MLRTSFPRIFASPCRLVQHLLSFALRAVLVAPVPVWAMGLNDTGQNVCYDYNSVVVACNVSGALPGLDAFHGRDAAAAAGFTFKAGGGTAGFDFTKICANGDAAGSGTCPANPTANTGPNPAATEWACTRDNVTGLLWSLESHTGGTWVSYSASATTSRCGQASGWRMPATRELLSIIHGGTSSPAIDTAYFPGTQSNWYWAAEVEAIDPADLANPNPVNHPNAWMVDFSDGMAGTNTKTDLSFPTRLVWGSAPTQGPFIVHPDATVTDTATSLMWDRCTYGATGSDCLGGTPMTATGDYWPLAFAEVGAANAAKYKGYDDWRLPNKNELESLVNRALGHVGPKIDGAAFPQTLGSSLLQGRYLTSTTLFGNPAFFDYVDFGRGSVLTGQKSDMPDTSKYAMRLVRGGNGTPSFDGNFNAMAGHLVSVAPTPGLAGTLPNGPQVINTYQAVAYTLLPEPGYRLESVSGCGGTLVGNVYTTSKSMANDCVVYPVMALAPAAGVQPVPAMGLPALLALAGLMLIVVKRRKGW